MSRDSNLFDLTTAPWIAAAAENSQPLLLSLRDVLTRPDPSVLRLAGEPPTRVAVLRLMMAILHDALGGPADDDTWARWWAAGSWPVEPVIDYLDRHQHRMRLFDPEVPFLQTREVENMPRKTVADLVTHRPSGNNPVLFSHNTGLEGPRPLELTAAEAARWVVAAHQFARCGLFPGPYGRGSATQAVLTNRHTSLPVGRTLTQTLLLNLTCYQADIGDVPPWRCSPSAAPLASSPSGLVQLLTWRTRLILLEPAQKVTECVHAADPSIATDIPVTYLMDTDPHLAFKPDRKDPKIFFPVTCDPDQATWRALNGLMGGLGATSAVAAAHRRTEAGLLPAGTWSVAVAGVAMEAKAKPVAWHWDEFKPVSVQYLAAVSEATDGLSTAFRKACGVACTELAAPSGKEAVGNAVGLWWRGVDRPARELLRNLATADERAAQMLLEGWRERLRLTALDLFGAMCAPYPPDIATRADSTARRVLHAVITKGQKADK